MREHYNKQLRELNEELENLGKLCDDALSGAIKALQEGERN